MTATSPTPGRIADAPLHITPHAEQRLAARSMAEIAAHTLLTMVIVVVAALVAAVAVVPRLAGATPLTVLTGSMTPALRPGDLAIVRPVSACELRVGDIVTFQPYSGQPTLITHRVVDIERVAGAAVSLRTQGDANTGVDRAIVPEQVMGRVWYHVPMIGRLTLAANPLMITLILGVGLLSYAVVTLAKGARDPDAPDPEIGGQAAGAVADQRTEAVAE